MITGRSWKEVLGRRRKGSHLVCPRTFKTWRIPSPSPQYRTAQPLLPRRSILKTRESSPAALLLFSSANRLGKGLPRCRADWALLPSTNDSCRYHTGSSNSTMCWNGTDKRSRTSCCSFLLFSALSTPPLIATLKLTFRSAPRRALVTVATVCEIAQSGRPFIPCPRRKRGHHALWA